MFAMLPVFSSCQAGQVEPVYEDAKEEVDGSKVARSCRKLQSGCVERTEEVDMVVR